MEDGLPKVSQAKAMNGRAVFAHPPEIRKKGKDALDKHGSLRKASAATGIPKSTLHFWHNNGGFEGLDDLIDETQEPATDAPKSVEQVLDDADSGSGTTDMEPPAPTGFPETPIDATKSISDAPPDGWPNYPQGGFAIYDGSTQQWLPDSPKGLQALLRYSNALIAGADPDRALHAAQIIDPDFGLTEAQHTRLFDSLSTLMMDERLIMAAINPPGYVRDTYDKYAWDDQAVSALSDTLLDQYKTAYTDAINSQLDALGRDQIGMVNDASLLQKLSSRADDMAQSIADSWNKDLANQVGQQWLDLSATHGTQMSQQKLDNAISDWQDARAEFKAAQWSQDAGGQADADALQAWQDNNNTVEQVRFEGDNPASCDICQGYLDDYGDWTSIDDCPEFGDIPHANCVLPDSEVMGIGDLLAGSRAFYRGTIVVLTTASGCRVRLTPKHPVLTRRGWLPAEAVCQSDDVIHFALSYDARQSALPNMGRGDVQVNNMPTLAADVFNALRADGSSASCIPAANDFHGDGRFLEGKVHVVRADSLLPDETEATIGQELSQPVLVGAPTIPSSEGPLSSECHSVSFGSGAFTTTNSGMGGVHMRGIGVFAAEPYAILEQAISDGLGAAPDAGGDGASTFAQFIAGDDNWYVKHHAPLRANVDAGVAQKYSDSAMVATDVLSETSQRLPAQIAVDQIVDVDVVPYAGHVYNFESTSHMFVADGIVTHNCVHDWDTQQADVPDDQPLWDGTVPNSDSGVGGVMQLWGPGGTEYQNQ